MNEKLNSFEDAVVVAFGGNLPSGGRSVQEVLDGALARLGQEGLRLLARSRWWRSAAWPDPSEPPFLNGVALFETALSPQQVLAALMRTEQAFGRERSAPNAPRTLDLDLIAHGRRVIEESDLQLPHPRAAERRFVMGPLAEIAPGWRHPSSGETAAGLALAASVGADAAPL